MTTTEQIRMVVFGTVNAIIFVSSAVIAFVVYRWNDTQKKRTGRLDLYKSLMTSEFLLKGRLISPRVSSRRPAQRNLPQVQRPELRRIGYQVRTHGPKRSGPSGSSSGQSPTSSGRQHRLEARLFVEGREGVREMYAWYWVNIIKDRQVPGNSMFCYHAWMTTDADIKKAQDDRELRLAQLSKL